MASLELLSAQYDQINLIRICLFLGCKHSLKQEATASPCLKECCFSVYFLLLNFLISLFDIHQNNCLLNQLIICPCSAIRCRRRFLARDALHSLHDFRLCSNHFCLKFDSKGYLIFLKYLTRCFDDMLSSYQLCSDLSSNQNQLCRFSDFCFWICKELV